MLLMKPIQVVKERKTERTRNKELFMLIITQLMTIAALHSQKVL